MRSEITLLSTEEYNKIEKILINYSYFSKNEIYEDRYTSDLARMIAFKYNKKYKENGLLTTTRDINSNNEVCLKFIKKDILDKISYSMISVKNIIGIPIKPIIKNASLHPYLSKDILEKAMETKNKIFSFGEYPQSYSSNNEKYEKAYKKNKLKETGKKYLIDNEEYIEYYLPDNEEHKGIRYVPKQTITDKIIGVKYSRKKPYWIITKKIKWVYIKELDIAIATRSIIPIVDFVNGNEYYGVFTNTNLKKYLDNLFSKEMLSINYYLVEKNIEKYDFENKNNDMNNNNNNNNNKSFFIIKKICIELIKDKFYENTVYLTLSELNNKIKEKYPDLTEHELNSIITIMMSLGSTFIKSTFYNDDCVIKEKDTSYQNDKNEALEKLNNYKQQKIIDELINTFSNNDIDINILYHLK